jgi:hypothetical protein
MSDVPPAIMVDLNVATAQCLDLRRDKMPQVKALAADSNLLAEGVGGLS